MMTDQFWELLAAYDPRTPRIIPSIDKEYMRGKNLLAMLQSMCRHPSFIL